MANIHIFKPMNQLLVYSHRQSNRLNYILRTLFSEEFGISVRVTTDLDEFNNTEVPRINYSDSISIDGFNIKPHSILFDHGIRDYHLEVLNHQRFYKIFFRNSGNDLPFDILGASFWLLSRYEEHLPFRGDQFNRFQYRSSLAYQYDFLQIPLVNFWMMELKNILQSRFPGLHFRAREYNFVPTIDIDNAYKYKFKGFVRTLAGVLRDGSISTIKKRFRIILNKETDPFDHYDFIIDVHKQAEVKSLIFFLLGDYGPNDKNHSSSDLRFQALIKRVADYSLVGIHPSFASNSRLKQLKIEVTRLTTITHRVITKSRQHMGMLRFPDTYKNLNEAGILADYSMGYTNANGFRASYCYPYKWYSLDIESRSSLTLHPFCISDNTLQTQSVSTGKTMMQLAAPIILEVKKYGGELISIFHNDNLDEDVQSVYREFLEKARP
jgi:hypothetical protein